MRRPPLRVLVAPLVGLLVVGALAVAIVRPRIPLLGIGATCVLDAADGGYRRVDTLRRVVALADGTSWAVGSRYSGAVGQPVAFRWSEGAWTQTEVPIGSERITSGLHDVDATGPADVWTVGSSRAKNPVAARWDGTAWTAVPTDGIPEGSTAEWLGVAASREGGVLAVGKLLDGLAYRTIVGRVEDGRLEAALGPNVGEGNNVLADVDLAGDVGWAVGWTVEDGVYRTLAARSAGGAWIVEPTPDPGAGDDVLTTVAVVDSDTAWAVGWSRDADGEPTPLVLRWDGETWTAVAPPPGVGRLLAVVATPDRVLVAGDAIGDDRQPRAFAAIRIDGDWEDVPTGDPEARWYSGLALWGAEDAVVAVGPQVVGGRYGSFVATGC